MKRPKVIRRRYTREAWRKIEEKAIEGMKKLDMGVTQEMFNLMVGKP